MNGNQQGWAPSPYACRLSARWRRRYAGPPVAGIVVSISIPRKDVKPIAYALINRFGSLEQVFAAGAADLRTSAGRRRTDRRTDSAGTGSEPADPSKSKQTGQAPDGCRQSCAYFSNLLRDKTAEQVYLVTLDGSAKILQTHTVGSGSVNLAAVDQRTLMEHILRDNASAVMLAHNHPGGKVQPSASI